MGLPLRPHPLSAEGSPGGTAQSSSKGWRTVCNRLCDKKWTSGKGKRCPGDGKKLELLGCWSRCFRQAVGSLSISDTDFPNPHSSGTNSGSQPLLYPTTLLLRENQPLSPTKIVSYRFQTRGRTPASTPSRWLRRATQLANTAESTAGQCAGGRSLSSPPAKTSTEDGKLRNPKWGEQEHMEVSSVEWRKKWSLVDMAQVFQWGWLEKNLEYFWKHN